MIFYAALALIVLDAIDTFMIVHHGKGHEANPGMRWLIARLGLIPGLVLSHLALMVLMCCYYREMPLLTMVVICAGYAFLFVNNMTVWFRK